MLTFFLYFYMLQKKRKENFIEKAWNYSFIYWDESHAKDSIKKTAWSPRLNFIFKYV